VKIKGGKMVNYPGACGAEKPAAKVTTPPAKKDRDAVRKSREHQAKVELKNSLAAE
jgi:hypothetical protein